jgi:MFS family permease
MHAAAPQTAGCADRAKPWVLAATILGSSLAFIDGSVVNVALPAIQADLATSVSATQWVVNAYMLPLSALILVGGAMLVPSSLAIISAAFTIGPARAGHQPPQGVDSPRRTPQRHPRSGV